VGRVTSRKALQVSIETLNAQRPLSGREVRPSCVIQALWRDARHRRGGRGRRGGRRARRWRGGAGGRVRRRWIARGCAATRKGRNSKPEGFDFLREGRDSDGCFVHAFADDPTISTY